MIDPTVDKQAELSDLDKQIELKRQELEALKIQEEAKTDRLAIGGVLAVLGIGLAIAASAAAAADRPKRPRRLF